jgi:tyrosyl-tRNA synthetase
MKDMKLSEELAWRGFANQTTYKDHSAIDQQQVAFYFGVDPSAPSMTVGNLAAAMMVRAFAKHGHKPVILIGGATGLIGDPDGKADERNLKTLDEIAANKAGIVAEYQKIFADFDFEVVDNHDWFKDIGYLEFLRNIGKHVPMRQMLGRDFVQTRLGEGGSGISYAEFSYVLIQAYDFVHLSKEKGVSLQLCGSDQWGNSIAGVDLIRRLTGKEAHVWSIPLVINKSTGIKFGKSEAGAVWLDPSLTSPYQFYQFWLNSDDEGIEYYLKIYTELNQQELADVMKQFNDDRSKRHAQKTLAFKVSELIHGTKTAESIARVSEVLFGNEPYSNLTADDFAVIKTELPTVQAAATGFNIIDILVAGKLASSKGEARRFLTSKAVYINGVQTDDQKQSLEAADGIDGHVIVRRGKNSQIVVEL